MVTGVEGSNSDTENIEVFDDIEDDDEVRLMEGFSFLYGTLFYLAEILNIMQYWQAITAAEPQIGKLFLSVSLATRGY